MWQSTSITRLSKPSSCVTRLPNQTPFCGSHSILTSWALMALRPALRRAASSLRRSRRDLKSVHCPFSHSSLDSPSAMSNFLLFHALNDLSTIYPAPLRIVNQLSGSLGGLLRAPKAEEIRGLP